jgi:Ferritin-like domain
VNSLTRPQALRRGLVAALVLAAAPGAAARAAAVPSGAVPLGAVPFGAVPTGGVPDGDLAYVRLLAAAELLKADFESTALASAKLAPHQAVLLRRLRADDVAHYDALAVIANAAGQPPPTAADIDFAYPHGTFASAASQLRRAAELTTLTLGAYLGALESVQTPSLRLPFAQIAANEAQQLSALRAAVGRPPVGRAFASALSIAAASEQLDRFES